MAFSKIILNGVTQIDLTNDTVASSNLLTGETATGADGESVVGAYTPGGGTPELTIVNPYPSELSAPDKAKVGDTVTVTFISTGTPCKIRAFYYYSASPSGTTPFATTSTYVSYGETLSFEMPETKVRLNLVQKPR